MSAASLNRLADTNRTEIKRLLPLLEALAARPGEYTTTAHASLHRKSGRFLTDLLEADADVAPVAPSGFVTIPLDVARDISGHMREHLEDWATGMDEGLYDKDATAKARYGFSDAARKVLDEAIAVCEGSAVPTNDAPEPSSFAISYRTDVRDSSKFNAMYAMPGDPHFRIGRDMDGEIARYDTAAEAEASAGHRLVALLRKQTHHPAS